MINSLRRQTVRHRVAVVLTALLALLGVGCGAPGEPTQKDIMDARSELAARPPVEDMIARYDEMLQRVRDRLDADLGPFAWYEADPRSWSGCGWDFSGLGGHNTSSPLWGFDGNIPDDRWPHARQIVADIAAEYGFATAGLQIDTPAAPGAPGYHLSGGVDTALGARYSFGTQVNTSLRVTTGCHPSASPKPWATSTPTPPPS